MQYGCLLGARVAPLHPFSLATTLRRSLVDHSYYYLNDNLSDSYNPMPVDMIARTLSFLATISLSPSQAWSVHPNVLVPVSNATCQSEYAWMNNAEQQSPCLAVAYVIGACAGDSKFLFYETLSCD